MKSAEHCYEEGFLESRARVRASARECARVRASARLSYFFFRVRHPDFVCIAAANTFGRGADRLYAGRNQLDESTLDRFRIGTVPMDYDVELERQLCPDEALRMTLLKIRQRVQENRLERVVSTRFMRDAAEMVTRWGWSQAEAVAQLFHGWRADEIAKVSL